MAVSVFPFITSCILLCIAFNCYQKAASTSSYIYVCMCGYWPPPRFYTSKLFRGGVVSPMPNPQPTWRTWDYTSSCPYPLTCLAWVALQRAYAPASIALWVTKARKLPLHVTAVVLEKVNNTLNKFKMSTACLDNTQSSSDEVKHTRATEKVTFSRLLTKQMLLYTKNTYIFKLLLNVVTAGIEAHVSGRSPCTPVSSAMFWHLPSTPHYCWGAVIPTSSWGRKTDGSLGAWSRL
jgi:hypothetical protein